MCLLRIHANTTTIAAAAAAAAVYYTVDGASQHKEKKGGRHYASSGSQLMLYALVREKREGWGGWSFIIPAFGIRERERTCIVSAFLSSV